MAAAVGAMPIASHGARLINQPKQLSPHDLECLAKAKAKRERKQLRKLK